MLGSYVWIRDTYGSRKRRTPTRRRRARRSRTGYHKIDLISIHVDSASTGTVPICVHVRSHGGMMNFTSLETIDHFNRILYWPHVVSYIVYLSQKILILFALCFHFVLDQCRSKHSQVSVRAEASTQGPGPAAAGRDPQNATNKKQYECLQLFDLFSLSSCLPPVATGASAAFLVATALAEKRSKIGLPLLSTETVPSLISG